MDSFAEKYLPERLGANPKDRIWNLLTLIILAATVCLVASFALTFASPHNFFNPFPPDAAAIAQLPSATPLATIPPTWTPTLPPTDPAVPTSLPAPTDPPAGATPTSVAVTAVAPVVEALPTAASQTAASPSGYPFQLRSDPLLVSAAISHPEQSCSWQGVGGEVFDLQNSPLVGLTIQMGGSLGGHSVNLLSLTGTATEYGPAGYEFSLGDKPLDSKGTLWLQLLDQAGLPLSPQIMLETSSDCKQNLVLVSFKQVR